MSDFILTPQDRDGNALWRRLMKHLREQRDTLRAQNDGDLDPIKTAHMRGRIAQLSAILALNEDKPDVPVEHFDRF